MTRQEEISNAYNCILSGGILLYPTDTIWGLGCDPYNKEAIEALFHLKERGKDKNFIFLVNSRHMLEQFVSNIPAEVSELLESDEPTTIIYPPSKIREKGLSTTDGSIAFRICQDDFCNDLIEFIGGPIISTSSNISGEASPKDFSEIDQRILKGVDYVVNLRKDEECDNPSRIYKLNDDNSLLVIRE